MLYNNKTNRSRKQTQFFCLALLYVLFCNKSMDTKSCKSHGHRHTHWLPKLDALGATAAFMCALHCAFLPVAVVMLPLATVEIFANHRFEQVFVIVAVLFGLLVMGSGVSRSRLRMVSSLFGLAVVLLTIGLGIHGTPYWHSLVMTGGGASLAAAHAINRHSVQVYADGLSLWKTLFLLNDHHR